MKNDRLAVLSRAGLRKETRGANLICASGDNKVLARGTESNREDFPIMRINF